MLALGVAILKVLALFEQRARVSQQLRGQSSQRKSAKESYAESDYRVGEYAMSLKSLNRRMHPKTLVKLSRAARASTSPASGSHNCSRSAANAAHM